ncbi:MAG TPA: hypothetical protein VGR06_29730 [Actinophytocola sp.]|uniref:hypothetical protein n=1 Tax=Actinophytocola sp. TaxID=1872138 RepID=UPI002DF8656C|nr:hypothetical protein [Actinophytocola sp.]
MTEPVVDGETARGLARSLREILQAAERVLARDGDSPLLRMITEHIGCPISQIPNVTERWPAWEHANLQRGVDAYLAEHSPGADWFGIGGAPKMHTDLMDMLTMVSGPHMFSLGPVDYTSVGIAPDRSMEAVQFGLVRTAAPDGSPVVLGVRGPSDYHPEPTCSLQVLATARETAGEVRE